MTQQKLLDTFVQTVGGFDYDRIKRRGNNGNAEAQVAASNPAHIDVLGAQCKVPEPAFLSHPIQQIPHLRAQVWSHPLPPFEYSWRYN
jgi:hypothetical protein